MDSSPSELRGPQEGGPHEPSPQSSVSTKAGGPDLVKEVATDKMNGTNAPEPNVVVAEASQSELKADEPTVAQPVANTTVTAGDAEDAEDESHSLDLLHEDLAVARDEIGDDNDDEDGDDNADDDDDDDDDDDNALHGDTWIEELECALLADCDPATLKKISEGRRIPSALRADYWRALLALNETGKVKLTNEYDLENQLEIRTDCEKLVEDIGSSLAPKPFNEAQQLRLRSAFESTITTYVKARPELRYVSGNGWTDILRVLWHLELNDLQLYQMFLRIVDRYIPKDLSTPPPPPPPPPPTASHPALSPSAAGETPDTGGTVAPNNPATTTMSAFQGRQSSRSVQAYHLLRLLIQYHDPGLCSILDSRKVTANLYVNDWFCSLFARNCPPKLSLLIWDTHFKMGDPFLIFFAAIVMVANASDQLKANLQSLSQKDMLDLLKSMPSRLEEDDVEDLYFLVANHYTNSTPRSIRAYSHLFFMDTFGSTYSGGNSPDVAPRPSSAAAAAAANDERASPAAPPPPTTADSNEQQQQQPLFDLKTSQLTSSLDLSQYLCLPIVPAEIFALDTALKRSRNAIPSSPGGSPSSSPSGVALRYFLVDCRPAEQYNAGHINRAFHLDCSLMLREPSSFNTAVEGLLAVQAQVVESKSQTGGQHLCFIGSGHEDEDQYVNMVVASFLQRYQKRYVSIVVGGFEAIHDYVSTKGELKDSFAEYIVDHSAAACKVCLVRSGAAFPSPAAAAAFGGLPGAAGLAPAAGKRSSSSASYLASATTQSLLASTTSFLRGGASDGGGGGGGGGGGTGLGLGSNLLAQSGAAASMLDKFASAFAAKSTSIKERLVETLNTTAASSVIQAGAGSAGLPTGHVSSQDRLGRRYTGSAGLASGGGAARFAIADDDDQLPGGAGAGAGAGAGGELGAGGAGGGAEAAGRRRTSSILSLRRQSRSLLDSGPADPGSGPDESLLASGGSLSQEPVQEIQLDTWQHQAQIIALHKCVQIKANVRHPGYIALSRSHLWILREIPHNKGFASIAAKRPLDTIVQITSKRRQPDLIIFRYGHAARNQPPTGTADGGPAPLEAQQQPSSSPAMANRAAPPPLASPAEPV